MHVVRNQKANFETLVDHICEKNRIFVLEKYITSHSSGSIFGQLKYKMIGQR